VKIKNCRSHRDQDVPRHSIIIGACHAERRSKVLVTKVFQSGHAIPRCILLPFERGFSCESSTCSSITTLRSKGYLEGVKKVRRGAEGGATTLKCKGELQTYCDR
jgi:hypothetical protein